MKFKRKMKILGNHTLIMPSQRIDYQRPQYYELEALRSTGRAFSWLDRLFIGALTAIDTSKVPCWLLGVNK